jgi:hypothetical protein
MYLIGFAPDKGVDLFSDSELEERSVVKQYLKAASDGKNYLTKHYSLQAIIAVGFKIENERAVQFRKWANQIVNNYTIQGWVMDAERLKKGGTLTDEFFERQLEKVREIRLSERKFYQKITDIYATSIDYDVTATATQRFFATVQNKLHWAIHGQTAADVILNRANAEKTHMGLTTWQDAPAGKIQRFDVAVAKNYLTDDEHLALAIPLSPTYPFMISLGSWNPVKTRDSERCGNWSQCPIKPIRFDG